MTLSISQHNIVNIQFFLLDIKVYEDTFTHGRYCGNNIHPVIISKSRLLYLRFFSDSQDEATGFTFRFSHVSTGKLI